MAELLFREDPYLKACDATIVAVHGDAIELDRTVFYPLGGGQAGDSGQMRGRFGAWRVLDTRKGPAGGAARPACASSRFRVSTCRLAAARMSGTPPRSAGWQWRASAPRASATSA